jgi:hypothetical protein
MISPSYWLRLVRPLAQGFFNNFKRAFKAALSKAVSVVVGVTQKVYLQ